MATWQQCADETPELAAAVRARFEATKHHVLATLRRDGSPRVSGTEVDFYGPDLTVGSLWGAVKARDLQRDGRFALHANPGDGSLTGGDAKVAGRAIEVTGPDELQAYVAARNPPEPLHLFRLDIDEVVLVHSEPGGRFMWIDTWRPGVPPTRFERHISYPPKAVPWQPAAGPESR
jgi:hypothetical protein